MVAMASSSSSSSLFSPPQQQLGGNEIEPIASNANLITTPNSSNHYSSGSIGPFFVVISVLAVLAVLSCFVGRICARRCKSSDAVAEGNPLEMIKSGGVLGWLRRKWRRCLAGDVEAGAKVADSAGKDTPKDNDQSHLQVPSA